MKNTSSTTNRSTCNSFGAPFTKKFQKGRKKNGREKRKCRHKVEGVIPSRLHLFCINSPQSSHHNPASRNVHNLCHGFVKYEQNVTALLHTQKKERSPTNASNMPRKVKNMSSALPPQCLLHYGWTADKHFYLFKSNCLYVLFYNCLYVLFYTHLPSA